jgi:hypothetical protein
MNRFARASLAASVLSLGLALGGCGSMDPSSFDPTAIFDLEIFNTKKKLPGERKAVFPEGTPGVPQGVPHELVKGYKPPEEAEAATQQAEAAEPKPEAKPKSKPKPRVVAKPQDEPPPTEVTVRPSQAQPQPTAQVEANAQSQPPARSQVQWPDPPPMQPRQPATAWPGSTQSSGGVAWPDPPATTPR